MTWTDEHSRIAVLPLLRRRRPRRHLLGPHLLHPRRAPNAVHHVRPTEDPMTDWTPTEAAAALPPAYAAWGGREWLLARAAAASGGDQ